MRKTKTKAEEQQVINRLKADGYHECQWIPLARITILIGRNGKILTVNKGIVITGYHVPKGCGTLFDECD